MVGRIFIASDHGGFELKSVLVEWMKEFGFDVVDLGTDSLDSGDNPDYVRKLCKSILNDSSKGILSCGTGIGTAIAANRFRGVRAALCTNEFMARMSREHNDANVLCLGGRVQGDDLAIGILSTWLNTAFSKDERHIRRLGKINDSDT
ncbi:MAG: ribose 5-phosphate isomerase B [Candidatus Dojkabacteria bacterium]|nr:ribose 5-phosphate isomerase B [Candidatus Dojkabacteria bacterium]